MKCLAGTYEVRHYTCARCEDNMISTDGSSLCQICPPSTYTEDGIQCRPCSSSKMGKRGCQQDSEGGQDVVSSEGGHDVVSSEGSQDVVSSEGEKDEKDEKNVPSEAYRTCFSVLLLVSLQFITM